MYIATRIMYGFPGFKWSDKSWYDNQPDVDYGDGDGTVNMRSLLGCLRWQGKGYPVHHKIFPNVDHVAILKDTNTIDYILQVVQGKDRNPMKSIDKSNDMKIINKSSDKSNHIIKL